MKVTHANLIDNSTVLFSSLETQLRTGRNEKIGHSRDVEGSGNVHKGDPVPFVDKEAMEMVSYILHLVHNN